MITRASRVRNSFTGSIVMSAATLIALFWTVAPSTAQDFDGREVAAALAKKDNLPTPRLADGHPDLGNSKGSWVPPGVGDMAGTGGGNAGTAKPEKKADVAFLPWAKAAYELRNANVTKDDPEAL